MCHDSSNTEIIAIPTLKQQERGKDSKKNVRANKAWK